LADPPCYVGGGNETNGAWVCRTLFDIVTGTSSTFSACVDVEHFIETDICNCCDGECPLIDPCPCACKMTMTMGMSETGVLVSLVGDSDEANLCVPPELSVKMVTGPGLFGRAVCVEECE
jgi:hypothetical protein